MGHKRAPQKLAVGLGKIEADIARQRRAVAIRQANVQSSLLDRLLSGQGLLSFFEQSALGGQRVGDIQQSALARQELASQKNIENLFQQRGLLGSGAELAAQVQGSIGFGQARSQAAASISRERLGQEINLTQALLGQATGFVGAPQSQSLTGLGGGNRGGSQLAQAGGQLFGQLLGDFDFTSLFGGGGNAGSPPIGSGLNPENFLT